MTNDRKKIIIKEITYWKKTKLLPSNYCDYLLALYTEGDVQDEISPNPSPKKLFNLFIYISNMFLVPLTFLVIYFTEIKLILQMLLLIILLIISLVYFRFMRKESALNELFSFIILLLNIFLVTVYGMTMLSNNYWLIFFTTFVNCIIWLLFGILKRSSILSVTGVIGVTILIIFTLI